MADKVLGIILPRDNTKVNIGTAELPKWKAPFVPDYFRGEQEYKKGNYTDPHAKAYAKKTSGKVESVSPEFELLGALGLKGIKWLFSKPYSKINNRLNISYDKNLVSKFQEKVRSFTDEELILPKGINPNSPVEQSKQYLKKRISNRGLEKIRNKKWDKKANSYFEFLSNPIDDDNMSALKSVFGKDINSIPLPISSNYQASYYGNNLKGAVIRNKNHALKEYNRNNRQAAISHEIGHAFSGKTPNRTNIEGFDVENIKYFNKNNYDELATRGTQIKNYFGLTSPDQEITPSMLKYAYKNYIKDTGINNNMMEFFNSITDFDKAAKWLTENSFEKGGKIK